MAGGTQGRGVKRWGGLPTVPSARRRSARSRLTPASILGPLLFADYWAADRDDPTAVNPRIVIAAGGGADTWPEEAERNSALSQFSAQTTRQPQLSATAFAGLPGLVFDGASDYLQQALSPVIAQGSRLYVWALAGWTGAAGADSAMVSLAASLVPMFEVGANGAGTHYGWLQETDEGTDSVHPHAVDAGSFHLLQGGTLATDADKFARDGVYVDGESGGGTLASAINNMAVGAAVAGAPGANFAACVLHRIVIAHDVADPTALPSAGQIGTMTALLSRALEGEAELPAITTAPQTGSVPNYRRHST